MKLRCSLRCLTAPGAYLTHHARRQRGCPRCHFPQGQTRHGGRLWWVQVNSAAVDAAGRLAVTVSADGTGRVWDLAEGRCTHVLSGPGRSSAGARHTPQPMVPASVCQWVALSGCAGVFPVGWRQACDAGLHELCLQHAACWCVDFVSLQIRFCFMATDGYTAGEQTAGTEFCIISGLSCCRGYQGFLYTVGSVQKPALQPHAQACGRWR